MSVRVLAHRCGQARGVENTLEAAAAALGEGADALEVDCQLTADGEPVLFHDDDTRRLTGLPGRVADLPWSELGARRARGSHRIPHLRDLLSWLAARPGVDCFLDFHQDSEPLVEAVVSAVAEARAWDRTFLLAFWSGRRLLERARALDARARVAVMPETPWRVVERCASIDARAACLGWDQVWWTRYAFKTGAALADLPGELARARAAGIAVSGGVANTPEEVAWFRDRGFTSVWSDDVVMARRVMEGPTAL